MSLPLRLSVEHTPDPEDLRAVRRGLQEYNASVSSAGQMREFGVFLRDAAGRIRGGVQADSWGAWLEIDYLWVEPALHRQGYGTQLLQAVEAEGMRRGCRWAQLDTYSFQAPQFYRKHGYQLFATLEGLPDGHKRFYFKKELVSAPEAAEARAANTAVQPKGASHEETNP